MTVLTNSPPSDGGARALALHATTNQNVHAGGLFLRNEMRMELFAQACPDTAEDQQAAKETGPPHRNMPMKPAARIGQIF
jgi:hypothetical protein